MPKTETRQPPPISSTHRRTLSGRPVTNRDMERLGRRFQVFRRSNSRITKIPVPLRKAVLAMLQGGVNRTALQKNCGVSWTQMDRWIDLYGPMPRPHKTQPVESARVLSVIDSDGPSSKEVEPSKQPLEFRIGGWSINVCPIDGQP